MNFTQVSIFLILLLFTTTVIVFKAIDLKTNQVEDELKIKKYSLIKENINSSINNNIDKIVLSAFINTSYKIMNSGEYFNNKEDALNYIKEYIKNQINKSLSNILPNNTTIKIEEINISPTNNPLIVNIQMKINIRYPQLNLKNVYIFPEQDITINKNVKLFKVPDPYGYLNASYTWHNYLKVNVFLRGNNYYIFNITLTKNNFNYSEMYNPNSPNEIRVLGNGYKLLPYWVESWRTGENEESVIWVNISRNDLFNSGYIYIAYNSSVPLSNERYFNVSTATNITYNFGNEIIGDYYTEYLRDLTDKIYYGDPKLYDLVDNGTYSIIGVYTGLKDSWGNVGYKLKGLN